MKVISSNNQRLTQIPLDVSGRDYRYTPIVFPYGKMLSNVFLATFLNPEWNLVVTTVPLKQNRHLFKIVTEDDYGNIGNERGAGVTITEDIIPPRYVRLSASGNNVILTWSNPLNFTPTGYKIYSNNGSGYIDRVTPLDTVLFGITTKTFNALGNGDWLFVIESYKGTSESLSYYVVDITLPTTAIIPPGATEDPITYFPTNVFAKNISVGKLKVSFNWFFGSEAKYFRLYHDSGTGTVDYSDWFKFERVKGTLQTYTTPQICTSSSAQTFKFVIRAESPDGIIETNTNEYTVTLEGIQPNPIISLRVESKY